MKKTRRVYVAQRSRAKARKQRRMIRNITVALSALVIFTVIFILTNNIFGGPSDSSDLSSEILSASVSNSDGTQSDLGSSDSDSSSLSSSITPTSSISVDREAAFLQLQSDVQAFADNFDGRIGISYINLDTDESYALYDQLPFVAASSIKMSIVTQLYKRVVAGELDLTSKIKYDSRPYPEGDYEAGTGIIKDEPNGTEFSIRRTAQLAITISDNCATNMIIRTLGGIDAIAPLLNDISAEVPYRESISYTNYNGIIESGKHRSSARDLSAYAVYLYDLWQEDTASYAPLLEDLENTVFTFGVQTLLPPQIAVAHKIGTNNAYRAENDVGIIFADETYVLCVMTETEVQSEGRDAVAEVSLMFHEYISSLYK